MKTFWFTGTLRKSGVWFRIVARNIDEARNLALRGEFEELDDSNAELADWTVDPQSAEEGEAA